MNGSEGGSDRPQPPAVLDENLQHQQQQSPNQRSSSNSSPSRKRLSSSNQSSGQSPTTTRGSGNSPSKKVFFSRFSNILRKIVLFLKGFLEKL
jgi:hypothetical protein